jgi:hypothetical protein
MATQTARLDNVGLLEKFYVLGYNALEFIENQLTFRKSISLPSS